jgi:hypothetical protein
MSSFILRNRNNPYFLLFVLIPLALFLALVLTVYNWLKANGAHVWSAIEGWVILAGVLLLVSGLVVLTWKVYKVWISHKREDDLKRFHNQIAEQSYLLLQEARINADNIDVKYTSDGAIEELKVVRSSNTHASSRIIEQLQAQVEELKQIASGQLQIEAPLQGECIPEVVEYRNVQHEVPADLSLLGVYPENGHLEIVGPDKYKTAWFVGASSSGKTNTVYGKVADAVRWGAKIIICDIHGAGHKADSLTNQLRDFHHRLLCPIATTKEQIKDAIVYFLKEFSARRDQGKPCNEKWLIVCDEVNAVIKMPVRVSEEERALFWETLGIKIKEEVVPLEIFVKALAETCGYESRGFDMFGYFISQKVAHLAWLRNAMMTVFVHRLVMDSEAILAANNDRKMAELVKSFKRGRTLVYGVEFEDPMVLQQPLYAKNTQTHIVESDIYRRPTVELTQSVPGNQTTIVLERSMESAQEADGIITQEDRNASTFELKKLLNEVGQMKAKGMSNAAILRHFELQPGGRNNTNLSALIDLSSDAEVENS